MTDVITRCMHCKCIRSTANEWMRNVRITGTAKDANFDISDGICPECMDIHYPEQNKIIKEKANT